MFKKTGIIILIVGAVLVVLGNMSSNDRPWVPYIFNLYQNTQLFFIPWILIFIGIILLVMESFKKENK